MIHFSTADFCDAHADLQVVEPIFKSFGAKQAFYGPIETVKAFEDNVLLLQALEDVPKGSVVVMDAGGSTRCAVMGDRLGGIAEKRGLAGVIIYGCVRDSATLAKQDIGVLALATNPKRSFKQGKGKRHINLGFATVIWQKGQFVYADGDGVIVSEKALH